MALSSVPTAFSTFKTIANPLPLLESTALAHVFCLEARSSGVACSECDGARGSLCVKQARLGLPGRWEVPGRLSPLLVTCWAWWPGGVVILLANSLLSGFIDWSQRRRKGRKVGDKRGCTWRGGEWVEKHRRRRRDKEHLCAWS